MLQVGIHDRDVARLARQHAFEARAGKAAPADPANATHAAIAFADAARGRGGSVGRIVVHEQHFPIASGENSGEPLDQDRNVGAFVEGRHDDAEFRCRAQRLYRGAPSRRRLADRNFRLDYRRLPTGTTRCSPSNSIPVIALSVYPR